MGTIALQANTIRSLTAKVEALKVLAKNWWGDVELHQLRLAPSSDGPGGSPQKAGKKPNEKGRKRGGPPKHKGSHSMLVAAEQGHDAGNMFPAGCDDCIAAVETPEPASTRH